MTLGPGRYFDPKHTLLPILTGCIDAANTPGNVDLQVVATFGRRCKEGLEGERFHEVSST